MREEKNIAQSLQEIEKLFGTELYRFAKTDTQELLAAGRKWLLDMQCGDRPRLPQHAAPFLQKVWALLPNFLKFCVVIKEEKDSKGVVVKEAREDKLSGREAAKALWASLEHRKVEDMVLEDIEPLMVHGYLLDESTADAVAKRSAEILKATRKRKDGGATSSKSSGSRAAPPPKKSKPSSALQDAAAATAALFS